jgi:uncharacterized membrane protein
MNTANILYVVALVVVIVVIVIWIASISRRAKRMSDASDARLASALADIANNPPATKPFTQETPAERSEQVVAMAEDDDETPAQITSSTKESRLAELAELHAKGSISDEELATARAKILAE